MLLLFSIIFDKLPDALILSLLYDHICMCTSVLDSPLSQHFKIPNETETSMSVCGVKIISNLTYLGLLNPIAGSKYICCIHTHEAHSLSLSLCHLNGTIEI